MMFLFAALTAAVSLPNSVTPQQPAAFEQNLGQFDARVRFLLRGGKYRAWITNQELVIDDRKGAPVRIQFAVHASPIAEGLEPQPGVTNYFRGNDRTKWVTGVPSFTRAALRDVYPGIDVVFYTTASKEVEYDFVVKPGADPSRISIRFSGAPKAQGEEIALAGGRFLHSVPRIHQNGREVRAAHKPPHM